MKLAVTCLVIVMLCCLLDNTVAQAPPGGGGGGQDRRRRDAPQELSPSDGQLDGAMGGPDGGSPHG